MEISSILGPPQSPRTTINMDQMIANTRYLLALNLHLRYTRYCPSPCPVDLSFIGSLPFEVFVHNLYQYFVPIQKSLESEYIVQRTQSESDVGQLNCMHDAPTDRSIIEMSQFLQVDEVILRLYIESFVKKSPNFNDGIETMIHHGTFHELACNIYWDLKILESSTIFITDGYGNLSVSNSVLTFSDLGLNTACTRIDSTTDVPARASPPVASLLYTTVVVLKKQFFDIPVRYQDDTRMWRFTHVAIAELHHRRNGGASMSLELEKSIRTNMDVVMPEALPTQICGSKRPRKAFGEGDHIVRDEDSGEEPTEEVARALASDGIALLSRTALGQVTIGISKRVKIRNSSGRTSETPSDTTTNTTVFTAATDVDPASDELQALVQDTGEKTKY